MGDTGNSESGRLRRVLDDMTQSHETEQHRISVENLVDRREDLYSTVWEQLNNLSGVTQREFGDSG